MTDTNQLPPLPEPEGVIVVGTQALRGFTADQMRAYALQSRAQLAQAVPMTDEAKEKALDLLATMFDAYENGIPCHEENGGGYIGMAFMLDDETFHACADILNAHRPKAHHGITAQAKDGGA